MKIVGKRPSGFTTNDGANIEGVTLYLTEEMHTPGAEGCSVERVFLSKQKLASLDFEVSVGQEVNVLYNKFGKVATLTLIDPVDDIIVDY